MTSSWYSSCRDDVIIVSLYNSVKIEESRSAARRQGISLKSCLLMKIPGLGGWGAD